MSHSPRVSVVVPFLNRASYLPECIAALHPQAGPGSGVELIFVDNGSTDESAAIVAAYDDITLLSEAEPGAYAARNTGIRRARAPIVALTDADCAVDPDWVMALEGALRDDTCGAVVGHCRYAADASAPLRLLAAWENAKAAHAIERCGPLYRFAYANNMAVRASLFDEIGRFRSWARAADSEWVHRLAQERPDLRLAFCPGMRITHREFRTARQRLRRLSLYTRTNRQIDGFRELRWRQRVAVAMRMLGG